MNKIKQQMPSPLTPTPITVLNLGLKPYQEVWDLQRKLHKDLIDGSSQETLILCEHHPVITMGKSSKAQNLLIEKDARHQKGIELFEMKRLIYTVLYTTTGTNLNGRGKKGFKESMAALEMKSKTHWTSGESLNWNPHIHGIASSDVLNEQGNFYLLDHFSQEKFTELFAHKLLSSMKKEEIIDESVVENILSWKHSGFSVWSGEPILPDQTESRLFLSKYIDRGPVAGSRISISHDIITYQTTDNLTHEFDPLEFLARLSPHIANKWESTVRYYGAYSHRVRGKQKKKTSNKPTPTPTQEPPDKKKASKTWAALIKQVYLVDPLVCPKCKGYMKIIAFIQDPNEISKILDSLNIPKFKSPPPLRGPPIENTSQEHSFC